MHNNNGLKHYDEWKSQNEMYNLMGIKSIRFMKHVMDEIVSYFPFTHRRKLGEEDLNE